MPSSGMPSAPAPSQPQSVCAQRVADRPGERERQQRQADEETDDQGGDRAQPPARVGAHTGTACERHPALVEMRQHGVGVEARGVEHVVAEAEPDQLAAGAAVA